MGITHATYLKSALLVASESYNALSSDNDRAEDLDRVKKDLSRFNGSLRVVLARTAENMNAYPPEFGSLRVKIQEYLEMYAFEQEIETLGVLYAKDSQRIRNMRLKILEAAQNKQMMRDAQDLINEL